MVNHKLFVQIDPATSGINVVDTISFSGDQPRTFSLNAALTPVSKTPKAKLKQVGGPVSASDVGMDRDNPDDASDVKLLKWKITGSATTVVIAYRGKIVPEKEDKQAEYQRGFSQYSGVINEKGTYLAGSTWWVPAFDDNLMTFRLTTVLPRGWKNVSQGMRTQEKTEEDKHTDTWYCDKPQEEVFLIAAPFTEYSYTMNNGVRAMAFLRTPDEGLANKYLEATEQYMQMYESMLGPYPYGKFALVENFWETGYGMPSFTLLGEKIIRFPFILHSSYPHELLHNWWGNSAYVDFSTGNWCEGITVFMADHLIKEQRGEGEEYRRSTLQRFTNLVTPATDFPLNKFRSRYDGPSEAIGYGKAMMMWQMLRRRLGDKTFLAGAKKFYEDNKFRFASFDDIRKSMEEVSGTDLKAFFDQWVNRTGAPEIVIKDIETDRYNNDYRIFITLEQTQPDDAFTIDLPINIATTKGIEPFVFNMNKKEQAFQIFLKARPVKLVVDPQYDVFRILDPHEVPPVLSGIWGSKDNVIVLPSQAGKEKFAMYKTFAEQWKENDNDHFTIVSDKDLDKLPEDKTAWILGFENKFAGAMNTQLSAYNAGFNTDSIWFGKAKAAQKGNSFVFTLFDKKDATRQALFVAFDDPKAIAGLVTKLPHYGKYSYLAFSGDEPANFIKGAWPVLHSPMVRVFDEKFADANVDIKRAPLAVLKPVFSEKRMISTIQYLSSDELKGRGLGTKELEEAAGYIAGRFKEAGLQPLTGTSYFQKFTHTFKDRGTLPVINVIGIIEGTDPRLKDYPVVVSAHYDHLGTGWPDVHKGDSGKIHHGADDNASGVAILLELARNMGKTAKPKRTIIFLACSGEEAGLIGSRYFVAHRKEYIKGEIFADVNLDTDGSLFNKKLLVLNANTAKEWKFIFMGTDYTTGVKSQVVEKQLDASDQVSFIEKGIPAVQLFTGATQNYHRPSDTWEKIDGPGLVKVATVTKEVITYLADREEPMAFTGKSHTSARPAPVSGSKSGKRVSTGSVPDFAYTGKGIRLSSVVEGSPGEKAGLKPGDIIVAVNGQRTDDLRAYSSLLKQYQPGDMITLTVMRGGQEKKIRLKLGER